MAKKRVLRKYDGQKRSWFKFALMIGAAVITTLIVFNVVLGVSKVSGNSMEPALSDGQIVFYSRVSDDYNRGDVVSIKMPSGEKYVKRIVAIGGDEVDINDNKLIVNGKIQSYGMGTTEKGSFNMEYPFILEKNTVFVLGDNRQASVDSRTFGPVVITSISGKLLLR